MSTPPRKLSLDEALADALAAYDARHKGERFRSVDFGTYADHVEHVGGGTWWRLLFVRSVSDEAERQPVVSDRAARLDIIRVWRDRFMPEPAPAEAVPRTAEPT